MGDKTARWKELARIAELKAAKAKHDATLAENIVEESAANRRHLQQAFNESDPSKISAPGQSTSHFALSNSFAFGNSLTKMLHSNLPRHQQLQRVAAQKAEVCKQQQLKQKNTEQRAQEITVEAEVQSQKKEDQRLLEQIVAQQQYRSRS